MIFKHLINHVSLAQLVECQTADVEVPSLNHGSGEFFSLKFFLVRKWTKRWRTRTRTTAQVIPWSLGDGRRQKVWGQEELNPGPLSPETSQLTTSSTINTSLSFGAVILGRWIEFQMTGRSTKSSTLLFTNSRSYVVDTMAKLGHPLGRFEEVFRGWYFCPASPLSSFNRTNGKKILINASSAISIVGWPTRMVILIEAWSRNSLS